MADEMNWGQLYKDSGDADKPLPNGPYDVEVTKCEAKKTSTGKTMFAMSAKVLSGPHAGRFVWNNITVSPENPNAMRMFFLNMSAFGLKEDFFSASPAPTNEAVAAALVGRRARFDVSTQTTGTYAGRNEVKSIKATGGPQAPGVQSPASTSVPNPGTPAPVPTPVTVPTPGTDGQPPAPTF